MEAWAMVPTASWLRFCNLEIPVWPFSMKGTVRVLPYHLTGSRYLCIFLCSFQSSISIHTLPWAIFSQCPHISNLWPWCCHWLLGCLLLSVGAGRIWSVLSQWSTTLAQLRVQRGRTRVMTTWQIPPSASATSPSSNTHALTGHASSRAACGYNQAVTGPVSWVDISFLLLPPLLFHEGWSQGHPSVNTQHPKPHLRVSFLGSSMCDNWT